MALADSAGGACALLNLPKDASGTATIESNTNFLSAVRSGTVTATATPLHIGGTTIVVETSVRDSSGRPTEELAEAGLQAVPGLGCQLPQGVRGPHLRGFRRTQLTRALRQHCEVGLEEGARLR